MTSYYADFLNSILAMDSYNRTYNRKINFEESGLTDAANGIDYFQVLRTSENVFTGGLDQNVGFSATAYRYTGNIIGAGIVIAYRGTDDLINIPLLGDSSGSDIWNGWAGGLGSPATRQAEMAIQFYKNVSSQYSGFPIELTGHSLGGGLAGMVAGIYHKTALVFDNMDFENAARAAYYEATPHYVPVVLPGGEVIQSGPFQNQQLYNLLYSGGSTVRPPSFAGVRTYYTKDEFLDFNRDGQTTPQTELSMGENVDLSDNQKHSISTLAMLTYEDARIYSKDWQLAGQYFWPVLYDHDFARAVGMDGSIFRGTLQTAEDYADILRMALAYSGVEYGVRPYGDTAIDAMFYDAIELGEVSKLTGLSINFSKYAESISKIFLQYAASLVVGQIMDEDHPDVLYGTLQDLTSGIHIDVSKATWELGNRTRSEIFGLEELIDQVFEDNGNSSTLKASMTSLWGTSSTDIIDFVSIGMKSGGVYWSSMISGDTIYRNAQITDVNRVDVVIGTEGSDSISGTKANNLIMGGKGDDTIFGSAGLDIIDGGEGYDIFTLQGVAGGNGFRINLQTMEAFSLLAPQLALYKIHNIENIHGSDYNDQITGSAGNDVIYGNYGDDYVYASQGSDILYGNGRAIGTNQFNSFDFSTAFQNNNTLDFTPLNSGVSAFLSRSDNSLPYEAYGSYSATNGTATGKFAFFEYYIFGRYDDVIQQGKGSSYAMSSEPGWGFGGHPSSMKYILVDAGLGQDTLVFSGADYYSGLLVVDSTSIKTAGGYEYFGVENIRWLSLGANLSPTLVSTALGKNYDFSGAANNPIQLDYSKFARSLTFNITSISATVSDGTSTDVILKPQNPNNVPYFIGTNHGDRFTVSDIKTSFWTGSGDDIVTLTTGGRAPTIYYSGGHDIYYFNSTTTSVQIYVPSGITTSITSSSTGGYYTVNAPGYGTITIYPSLTAPSIQTYFYNPNDISPSGITKSGTPPSGTAGTLSLLGGSGNDTLYNSTSVRGGAGNDTITGTSAHDDLYGEHGNDIIDGGADGDNIDGGFGNDTLNGGAGKDYIVGGPGDDIIDGGLDNDHMFGDTGNDTIYANLATLVTGAEGVYGGDGFDTLKLNVSTPLYTTALIQKLQEYMALSQQDKNILFKINDSISVSSIEKIDLTVNGVPTNFDPVINGTTGNDTLNGTAGDDKINGLAGNDTLNGNGGNDILDGGVGTDILNGGAGNDTYTVLQKSGLDTISDTSGTDTIVFGAGIIQNTVTYAKSGNDLVISVSGNPVVKITGHFTGTGAVETLSFSGGANVNLQTLVLPIDGTAGNDTLGGTTGNDIINGLAGNDILNGLDGNDILDGGTGTDTLNGGAGNDTYNISQSSGLDTITDTSGTDKIVFGSGITQANTTYARSGNDLAISVSGSQVAIVSGHFSGTAAVETLQFSDGTTVNLQTLSLPINGTTGNDTLNGTTGNDVINGLAGNDTLNGNGGNDTFDGGAGTDAINGGAGNDIYNIASGSGLDTITDSSGTDRIVLGTGILQANTTYARSGNDLLISVSGTQIARIVGHYAGTGAVETLQFSNGTTVNLTTLSMPINGTTGNDTLNGTSGDNVINGLAGNDTLNGNGGNDTFDGGAGTDAINGGAGNDTYNIASGSGLDTITDTSGTDRIVLGTGILQANTTYARSGNDLTISVSGTQIARIFGHYAGTGAVETLQFSDGTTVNLTTLNLPINGTTGNDTLNGTSGNDVINGLAGNDTLNGNGGNDTFDGGAGTDTINGGAGNDTYNIASGSGLDTITDTAGTDKIVFGSGLARANMALARDTTNINDLAISFSGTRVALVKNFFTGTNQVETIQFSDGSTYNLLTHNFLLNGTTAADTLTGYSGVDTIRGGAGNDTLYGGAGNDTLFGDAGNDTLRGEAGNDIYVFDGGLDRIYETGGTDTLQLGAGMTVDALVFSDVGTVDTKMAFSAGVNEVTLYGQRGTDANVKVETVTFLDGFSANLTTYKSWVWGTTAAQTTNGTTGVDTILGRGGNDTINGNAGNDALHGGAGNDTVRGGDGNDLVHGGVGNDTLYGDAGNDVLYGDDGLDNLYGGAGADTFKFLKETAFRNIDVINDFNRSQSDKIDISSLLQGYDPLTNAITDFVQITTSGANSILRVDVDGGANNFVQIATLNNVTGLTDEQALVNSGNLVVS